MARKGGYDGGRATWRAWAWGASRSSLARRSSARSTDSGLQVQGIGVGAGEEQQVVERADEAVGFELDGLEKGVAR